jgi:DNA polymerase (family X)
MAANTSNDEIADVLDRIGELLDFQNANPFRVQAYRNAAQAVRSADEKIADVARSNGLDPLIEMAAIGEGTAAVIGEYVSSGKSALLEELESKAAPGAAYLRLPGIGKDLAGRIVDELHIRTLAELEEAAHDGRLASVEGFGKKRVEGIRTALAGMLSRSAQTGQRRRTGGTTSKAAPEKSPPVALLLEIDETYRTRAGKGELRMIAPRRFNPNDEAWLPVMNVTRGGWEFTAMYSNTAQAHKLKRTDDWVVIYFERDGREGQHTVVTETRGPLEGKRVVRGREGENREYYKKDGKK